MKGKLIVSDESRKRKTQHTTPCSDCPFARASLKGWLGPLTADEWVAVAHGEQTICCHVFMNQQCAGAAIYRANVVKLCRDRKILQLPGDTKKVFSTPTEFRNHHTLKGKHE